MRIQVISGHKAGEQGILIKEFKSVIHGKEVDHLLNRTVRLDSESRNRTYAAKYIRIL